MEPIWRAKTNLRKELPPKIVAIASDARLNNCWVFHKPSKKWFTPEEFLQEGSRYYRTGHGKDNSDEFSVRSPWEGLRDRIETLKRVGSEIDSFQRRIEDYYRLVKS